MKMKGVILAGGNGTRMLPLTRICSKHLLPVGNKPMLQHSVDKLVEAGIDEIMIVTGGEHLGGIAEFLGSGKDFGCNFTFRVQDRAGGIAEALGLAKNFVGNDSMCILLGDNMFEESLKPMVDFYLDTKEDCLLVVKEVSDPKRFGVAEVRLRYGLSTPRVNTVKDMQEIRETLCGGSKNGIPYVVGIEEKPENPKSNFAVTGIYFYDSSVFDIVKTLKPSGRGELEITDVNNNYINTENAAGYFLDGWWTDAGTLESYRRANELVWKRTDGEGFPS